MFIVIMLIAYISVIATRLGANCGDIYTAAYIDGGQSRVLGDVRRNIQCIGRICA